MSGLFVHPLQLPFWHNHANLRNAQWNTVCSLSRDLPYSFKRVRAGMRAVISHSAWLFGVSREYISHICGCRAQTEPRAGQRQLLSQLGWYHLMPGNYSERGKLNVSRQKFPKTERKGSAWIPGCFCTLIPLALSLRQAFCTTHQGKLGKREFTLKKKKKKEHMTTITNQVRKKPR